MRWTEVTDMVLSRLFRRGASARKDAPCSEILEVLQSYLDGETATGIARDVAVHLDGCDHCEHESLIYRRIKVSLTSNQHHVDPEVLDALMRFGQRLARGEQI
jgi:anti-sigma factor RsiW